MTRTTRADLDNLARSVDTALDLPTGTHAVQVAYGRPRLIRYVNPGQVDVSPRLPSGELERWIRAYLAGIWAVQYPYLAR